MSDLADEGSSPRPNPGAPRRLGEYELLEEIARGGMGVIYRARQHGLNRFVAVKVLLAGHFASPSFFDRFRREAEAAASLNHPNIVSVYEVGTHLGQPYYSMELIEGRNLAELVREQPMTVRSAAQLLKTIAEAVHYAHERGVLHRDLKPSNVLVDKQGVPHVADFGLAKRLRVRPSPAGFAAAPEQFTGTSEPAGLVDQMTESVRGLAPSKTPRNLDDELTLTGQVLGSPNFMPPEQADPNLGPTTAASDVYSLGAILYHFLTGRPPFLAETVTQTLRLVAETEAVSPRLLSPGVPRDLETICVKCLEKDARRRYSSARELADELGRFLNDEPTHARPLGPVARLARWCRRKPAAAFAISAGIALLLVIAIGSPIAIYRIDAARQQEAALRSRAEFAERETGQQLYTALLEQARATVLSGEMGQRVRALDAIRRAATISNSAELRREVFAALALPDLRFERELPHGQEFARALDPSFERIALAVPRGRGPVEIRATSDQRLLATLPASTNLPVYVMEWSADARFLAVKRDRPPGGLRADWEVWETANWRRILLLRDLPLGAVAFHPRHPRVFLGQRNGATIWDLENGTKVSHFPLDGTPFWLRFSPDGERFAALYELKGGWIASVHEVSNPSATPRASHAFAARLSVCNWHPSGRWMALPDLSGNIHWMDAQTGETRVLGRHRAEAVRAEFSPDGAYLISGAWGDELICWDVHTLRRAFSLRLGYEGRFRADGRAYALAAGSGVRLHAFERPSSFREFEEDLGTRLEQAAISPDGRWLVASADQRLGLWDLTAHGPGALDERAARANGFFTPDGSELFANRTRDGTPVSFRWRIEPATNGGPPRLERLPLHWPPGFTALALRADSVVMTGTNGTRVIPRDEAGSGPGPNGWKPTVAGLNQVSPDGRWLGVLRRSSATLHVYRLPGLEPVARLTQLPQLGNIHSFDFSPAADEVALSSSRSVELWSTATWQRTRALTNFTRPLLYAPDGRSLWLTKDRRAAGLYDARTLEPQLLLPTGMLPLAISQDGRQLAVSVDGQRLQVWDLASLREQFRALGLDWPDAGREKQVSNQ